jgi:hypothetical protein
MTLSPTPRSAGFLAVEHVGPGPMGGEHYRVGDADVIQTDRTHFSISCADRDPTWGEIASARYALLPRAKDCVMVLPPDWHYANLHEHCFHVHMLRTLAPGGRFHSEEAW